MNAPKTKTVIALAGTLMLGLATGLLGAGGEDEPDLSWYSVDCGGGVSSGGGFEITSLFGQPDAGAMSGSDYAVTGGFLSIGGGSAPPCPADLDGDGSVGFGDLLAVLAAWGACEDCPEDIDESGEVDFNDVLAVLSAWGPCP